MSLVTTLGKIALGAMAAKSLGKVMGGGSANSPLGGLLGGALGGGQGGGALGSILGALGGSGGQQQSGGLGSILGALGGMQSQQGGQGGLGSILGALGGGSQGQQGGGLGAILGALGGSQGGQQGGLGGLLDSLGGSQTGQSGGIGGLLNQVLGGQTEVQTTPSQEQQAQIMLRAVISACKADGQIDENEQAKIAEHLGDDVTAEEAALVKAELEAPLDIHKLVASVPQGMEQQVYFMSLLAIDLDSKEEAVYLDQLAKGLELSPQVCNAIHEKVGVQPLYS